MFNVSKELIAEECTKAECYFPYKTFDYLL